MEYSFDKMKELISQIEFNDEFDMVVAVANGGIIPAAMLNQHLNKEFNIIKINLRDPFQRPLYDEPKLMAELSFDPKNRHILLVEDRVKSGASLAKAKQILLDKGASSVKTFAVNGKADYPLLDVSCFKFPWLI